MIKFEDNKTVLKIMKDQKETMEPSAASGKEPSPLAVKASLRPDAQVELVSVVDLEMEEVDCSTTLKDITHEAQLDYTIEHTRDIIDKTAHQVQGLANVFLVLEDRVDQGRIESPEFLLDDGEQFVEQSVFVHPLIELLVPLAYPRVQRPPEPQIQRIQLGRARALGDSIPDPAHEPAAHRRQQPPEQQQPALGPAPPR